MGAPGVAGRLIGWPLVHRRSGMKRISLVHKSILLLLVVNLWAGTALARAPIAVSVNHAGSLSSNGEVVTLSGKIRCAPGYEVLEAFIYVVQDQNTSQFAALPVTCDGRTHRFLVTVPAYPDSGFHAGRASASGYILLQDPATGNTVSTSPTGTLRLR
jgi:hypothetical protein